MKDWFAEFRAENKKTFEQRELITLPEDILRAYLAVNRAFYQGLDHDEIGGTDFSDSRAIEYASKKTGLSIEKTAEIIWETFNLYDPGKDRWCHENTWTWKLFKRLPKK